MNSMTALDTQASARIRTLYALILRQADEMEKLALEPAERLAKKSVGISGWNVVQHLEHLAISAEQMLKAIDHALTLPPPDSGKRPTLIGYLPLWIGAMPRGKAKCPPEVLPKGQPLEELRVRLRRLQDLLGGLGARLHVIEAATGRTRHPMLGYFTPYQWLQMLEIHQRHHFKIIRDIRAVKGD